MTGMGREMNCQAGLLATCNGEYESVQHAIDGKWGSVGVGADEATAATWRVISH